MATVASMTVMGFGDTTSRAYKDALFRRDEFTAGDPRPWVVTDQNYRIVLHMGPGAHVVCELTLELIETDGQ